MDSFTLFFMPDNRKHLIMLRCNSCHCVVSSHLWWWDFFLCDEPTLRRPDPAYQISRLSSWPAPTSQRSSPPQIDMLDGNPRIQGGMKQVQVKVSRHKRQKVRQKRSWKKAKRKALQISFLFSEEDSCLFLWLLFIYCETSDYCR